MKDLTKLLEKIEIPLKNKKLLQNVFIHRSYLNENKKLSLSSNEKLEFLGDSVLSLATSVFLFQNYPHLKEGDYTEIKAAIVRTESLAEAGKRLNLGSWLYLSKGQEREGGRSNINILADCFEALIAAIFLERGFEAAYQFIVKQLFRQKLDSIIRKKLYLSPKSRLQEYTQARYKQVPAYKIIKEEGPEHKRIFKVVVLINKRNFGFGLGKSKKEAEENAAKKALVKLGIVIYN